MTSTVLFDRTEAEQMVRNTMLLLYSNLNNTISTLESTVWSARDTAFAAAFPHRQQTISVEQISQENFYAGHVPSLIDADISKYPNVAVMNPNLTALQATDDHMDQYAVRIFVEIMVKAESTMTEPDQDADAIAAELVNARLMRTVQAAHSVLKGASGRNLSGIVPKFANTPTITNGDVFVRRAEKGRGPRWLWQGARMDYVVNQWVKL